MLYTYTHVYMLYTIYINIYVYIYVKMHLEDNYALQRSMTPTQRIYNIYIYVDIHRYRIEKHA